MPHQLKNLWNHGHVKNLYLFCYLYHFLKLQFSGHLNTLLNIGNQFSSQFGINLGGIPAFGQFNQALGQLGAVQGLVSQAQGFVSNVRSVFGGFF